MTSSSPRSVPAGCFATSKPAHGAFRLTELLRFTDPAEAAAIPRAPRRRTGSHRVLSRQQRVHVGDLSTTTEHVFTAWVSDR